MRYGLVFLVRFFIFFFFFFYINVSTLVCDDIWNKIWIDDRASWSPVREIIVLFKRSNSRSAKTISSQLNDNHYKSARTRDPSFLSRSPGFVIFVARFSGRTSRRKCSKTGRWNGMKPRKAASPLFLFLRSALFSFRLFSLRSFPTFPVEQRAQEPTSFPMHQEDVRTAWPGSFHPSRFRHRYTRDFSPYIYSQTGMNKEREKESNDTWRSNVRSFFLS